MIDAILSEIWSENGLVHIGAVLYLIAFLFRDQLFLRLFVVAGDTVYVLYFYFAPETPLWGGIFWSTLFILVNVWTLFALAAGRRHFRLTPDEKALFEHLHALSPGEFRSLLRIARFTVAEGPTELSTEGQPLDRLHVVVDGQISVIKNGREVARDRNAFVGEVAFLLGRTASATVIVGQSGRYFSWSSDELKALVARRPEFGVSLAQAMNRNLARKLAEAGVALPRADDRGSASHG